MATLFDRTIANGGGTFEMHAENGERADIKSGFAVGLVDGTFAYSRNDRAIFNREIARVIEQHPEADAIGTWIADDGRIHIDPVRIFTDFDDALAFAIEKKQIAFFNLATQFTYDVDFYIRAANDGLRFPS